MVVKIQENSRVKIEHISLGNDLVEVREKLSKIELNKPGIHILKLQPGVGKTHAVKEFLKGLRSFLLLTGAHKLIEEEYEKLGAKHWQSFTKLCKHYKTVGRLHKKRVPIKFICESRKCIKTRCKYWKQFSTKKAIAPYHFLPTDRVKYKKGERKGTFKFDVVVVDESMDLFRPINFNKKDILESVEAIYRYVPNEKEKELLIAELNHGEFNSFDDYLGRNGRAITHKKFRALKRAIKENDDESIGSICRLDLFEIKKFFYYKKIHSVSNYSEPLFYNILDLARQGTPIILLDATFNEEASKILIDRYMHENKHISRNFLIKDDLGPLADVKITIYESEIKNTNLRIYRMDRDNYYYRAGFFDYSNKDLNEPNLLPGGQTTIEQLRKHVIKAKRKHIAVGIITYHDLMPKFEDLGRVEYFGNLRGSNKIKDADVLFIIGTPMVNQNDIVEGYNNLVLTDYQPDDVQRLKYEREDGNYYLSDRETGERDIEIQNEKKPNPLFYKLYGNKISRKNTQVTYLIDNANEIIYSISDFDLNSNENEKYQAIHRARPFLNDNVKIYIFGDVPEKIKEEFTVELLNKEETRKYFTNNFKGVDPLILYEYIKDYYTNNGEPTSLDIASKLQLVKSRKKKNLNTPFITTILSEISIKDINKIDKGIKGGLRTVSALKRKFRSLNVEDDFIEDCIYYSEHGSYIFLN